MLPRRSVLVSGGRLAIGLLGASLLRQADVLGMPRASAEPDAAVGLRVLASGTGVTDPRIWVGRGCSGLGSSLEGFSLHPTLVAEIDFSADAAVVMTGISAGSLVLGGEGASIVAAPGSDWAVCAVARDVLAPALSLQLGETTLSAAVEG